MKKASSLFLLVLFFVCLFSYVFVSSDDLTQDLGRHLKLGEIIVKTKNVPKTNLFSYTNPSFSFVNHHWLSEVIYYLLVQTQGMGSLILLKTVLVLLTFGIIVFFSSKRFGVAQTLCAAGIFFMPFIHQLRIRPELFGYVFFAYFVYLLFSDKQSKWIYIAPLIMILWVNLHISFVFGLCLLFLLKWHNVRCSWRLFFVSLLVTILNPNGIKGALYPFFIFGNYGYSIVENQSLFFLSNTMGSFFLFQTILGLCLAFIALFVLLYKRRYFQAITLLIFGMASLFQVRHLPFFVIVAIPCIAESFWWITLKIQKATNLFFGISFFFFLIMAYMGYSGSYFHVFDYERQLGVSVNDPYDGVANYIIKNNLPGPIMNGFDIGGYLIYRLYPTYRVFMDNRPEAYPTSFIQEEYIRPQEQEKRQSFVFDQYKIKTIVFNHTDQTPWARTFLSRIAKDSRLKLVYFDGRAMVFTTKEKAHDIREDSRYFINRVSGESDFFSLASYLSAADLLGDTEISNEIVTKLRQLRPESCFVTKLTVHSFENSPILFQKAEVLKNNSWWCY